MTDIRKQIIEACAQVCEAKGSIDSHKKHGIARQSEAMRCAAVIRALDPDKLPPMPEPKLSAEFRDRCKTALHALGGERAMSAVVFHVGTISEALSYCIGDKIAMLPSEYPCPKCNGVGSIYMGCDERIHCVACNGVGKIRYPQDKIAPMPESDQSARIAELESEITRLRAGGCARDQGLTQYCAEASDARGIAQACERRAEKAEARIAELESKLAEALSLLREVIKHHGEYGPVTLMHRIDAALAKEQK